MTWKGQLEHYSLVAQVLMENTTDDRVPCEPGFCDRFTLSVSDSDVLTIVAKGRPTTEFGYKLGLRIKDPSGAVSFIQGDVSPKTALIHEIPAAQKGDYVIDVTARGAVNRQHVQPAEYTTTATLGRPAVSAPPPIEPNLPEAIPPAPPRSDAPARNEAAVPAAKGSDKKSRLRTCTARARRIKSKRRRARALKECRSRQKSPSKRR